MTDRPCGHYVGAEDRHCGAVPARLYLPGPRCAGHTPAAMAGRPEPGQGAYCPPRICWCCECPWWDAALARDPLSAALSIARQNGERDPGHHLARTVRTDLTTGQDAR